MLRCLRSLHVALLFISGVSGCVDGRQSAEELHVFAASSLRETFEMTASRFSELEPGVQVRLSFAGSQILRTQIAEGARADVFASANMTHVQALQRAGHLEQSQVFARGRLVLVTPLENSAGINALSDLAAARRVVLGTPMSPIGEYTERCLQSASGLYGDDFASRVASRVVSRETNARLVRAKVEMGEADAAIIYRSDTQGRQRLNVVELPDSVEAEAAYVQGRILSGGSPTMARRWLEFIASEVGQGILREHGFEGVM